MHDGETNGATVWIVGAGFSKGLAGPLIADLLARRDRRVLETHFPVKTYHAAAEDLFKARLFFNYGLDQRYWDHAEHFLDLVESAAIEGEGSASHARGLLTAMLHTTVAFPEVWDVALHRRALPGETFCEFRSLDELASACRRALAADCSLFLRSAQLDSERWSPYKRWSQRLGKEDTVVTFNYDHVPELLAREMKTLRVIDPSNVSDEIGDARHLGVPVVLKVHGSVTWRRRGDGIQVLPVDDPAVGDPSTDAVIGVPGPGKRAVYRKTLKALRMAAVQEIRKARKVVFLGYRFPTTDADAREDVLDALRSTERKGKLEVHTVLGPDIGGRDSRRLTDLLERSAGAAADVRPVPLFVEDYIGLL